MTKINTAGDFGTSKWKEDFYKQESLTGIIDSTDIDDYKFHKIEKTYTVNDNRVGAIIQMEMDGRMKRATIDFKRGYATWNQLMDITFNIGNDCDYLLAVYGDSVTSGDMNKYDDVDNPFCGEALLAGCFVDVLLSYGKKANLLRGERRLDQQDHVMYDYTCYPKERYSSKTLKKKLPSKRQFQEREFWMVHWNVIYGPDLPAILETDCWFNGGPDGYHEEGLDFNPYWSDKGLFYTPIPYSVRGIEALEWLWKNKRKELHKELQKVFKDCQIRMHKKDGRPSKLSVRILDKPFREVFYMDFNERADFGEYISCFERPFTDVIVSLLDDMPEKS